MTISWFQICSALWATLLLLLTRVAAARMPGTGAISGIVSDPANHGVANLHETAPQSRSVATMVIGSGRSLEALAPEVPNATSIGDEDSGNSVIGIANSVIGIANSVIGIALGSERRALDRAVEKISPLTGDSRFRFPAVFLTLTNASQGGNPNTRLGLWRSKPAGTSEFYVRPNHRPDQRRAKLSAPSNRSASSEPAVLNTGLMVAYAVTLDRN